MTFKENQQQFEPSKETSSYPEKIDISTFLKDRNAQRIDEIKILSDDYDDSEDDEEFDKYDDDDNDEDYKNNYDDKYTGEEDYEEHENKIEIYQFKHHQKFPYELPRGYFLDGGAARQIILKEFGEKVNPPRDIDIVAIREYNPDTKLADKIGKQYMPDDYSYGYGVKTEKMKDYFKSIDFILNEVLVDRDTIIASKRALKDLKNKVIRPTEYEKRNWHFRHIDAHGLNSRLVMKALRFQIEFDEMYDKSDIQDIKDWQWELKNIPVFFIALALEKSQKLGDKYATRFLFKLMENGIVSLDDDVNSIKAESLKDLALNIRWRILQSGKNPFKFAVENWNKDKHKDTENEDFKLWKRYEELAESYKGPGHHKINN